MTHSTYLLYVYNWMNRYSTRQAAKQLGLSLMTIQRYIAANKLAAPPLQRVGDVRVRLWSRKDIEKVRKILPKIANGRKTRYQKQRAKKRNSKKVSKKR